MNSHRIITYEKSIIKSNDNAINNLLNILYNFGYLDQNLDYKSVSKKYVSIVPMFRISSTDHKLLSKTKTYRKENYDITMEYVQSSVNVPNASGEIIFTLKQIYFEQLYSYIPEIYKINVSLKDDIVELEIVIKYNLKTKHKNAIL